MGPNAARGWLDLVLDPGWTELFDDVVGGDPLGFPGYVEQLADARARTGCSESVVIAEGAIDGQPHIAISFEFGFLGGSMGVAAGERICRAFERAAETRASVIALTASGGARMQEGMRALAQMPATIAARQRLMRSKQRFTAYLRNPTTGGVFASFANTADLIWAEPGATIGFAGPRVAEAITGEPLPKDSHTAESALAAGLIDDIVPPSELRARIVGDKRAITMQGHAHADEPQRPARSAWDQVLLARHPKRPTGADYVRMLEHIRGPVDPTVVTGVAVLDNHWGIVVIAHDRTKGTGRTTPAGYQRARNAIARAVREGAPIVTFIDTPGADPSAGSEHEGIAAEIAATFDALLAAPVPTVACVVGEGGSGGALALAACDRILILQNAIFSVIAPEGAASILKRDDIASVANDLKLTAHDMRAAGLADLIVPEPAGGAHADPEAAIKTMIHNACWALEDIRTEGASPTPRRRARWRAMK